VLARELGVTPLAGEATAMLGRVVLFTGDGARAIALLRESLEIARATGDARSAYVGLEGLAFVAALRSEPRMAGHLFGAAHGRRAVADSPLEPVEQATYQHYLSLSRSALSETAWNEAWSAGAAMPFDGAIAHALDAATVLQGEPEREPRPAAGLSRRE
jgi:hypothetical protein